VVLKRWIDLDTTLLTLRLDIGMQRTISLTFRKNEGSAFKPADIGRV
jgi:hypothetical protein